MAPEVPPLLVVWDLDYQDGELKGTLEYVEILVKQQRLRVLWSVEDQPEGYFPVGDGVAYVYGAESVVLTPISKAALPEPISDSRYRLVQGLAPEEPWLMMIVILPFGYSLVDPKPLPARAKSFKRRLALYWILEGDKFGRTQIEWGIKEFNGDSAIEAQRINRSYAPDSTTLAPNVEVGRLSIAHSAVNIFLDKSQQNNQSGGVSIRSDGDTDVGGNVIGRDNINSSSS